MKKFIRKIFVFISILLFPIIIGAFLPATPKAKTSMIFGNIMKDSLLNNVKGPRIIFIGGSNLSFGLNSQMIKDSLNLNPINTGIHASIGLKYMMKNALEYIRQGDTVILVPEYQQFIGDFYNGNDGQELTRTIFDVNLSKIKLLDCIQIKCVLENLPIYSLSKFNLLSYLKTPENNLYSVNSFNEYGDVILINRLQKQNFEPYGNIGLNINMDVFKEIHLFNNELKKNNAILYLSFPGYQEKSFVNSKQAIKKIKNKLINFGINLLNSPDDYMMTDSLMFDTPYHLNKYGVDYRTKLFINDFKKNR